MKKLGVLFFAAVIFVSVCIGPAWAKDEGRFQATSGSTANSPVTWVVDTKEGHVWMLTPTSCLYQGRLSSKMEKGKTYDIKEKWPN